jgi:hypothetical protein
MSTTIRRMTGVLAVCLLLAGMSVGPTMAGVGWWPHESANYSGASTITNLTANPSESPVERTWLQAFTDAIAFLFFRY